MEMNLADRPAVNLAFRFRDQAVNRFCVGFHPVGNSQAVDQRFDISGGSMVVMSVFMRVLMAFVMVMVMVMVVRMFMVMRMFVVMRMFMVMIMRMVVPVFMVVSFSVRGLLLDAVHGHPHVRSGDPAFYGFLCFNPNTGKADPVHLPDKGLFVIGQLQQRRGQHIPRRAH